jgi:hypothetical protein
MPGPRQELRAMWQQGLQVRTGRRLPAGVQQTLADLRYMQWHRQGHHLGAVQQPLPPLRRKTTLPYHLGRDGGRC